MASFHLSFFSQNVNLLDVSGQGSHFDCCSRIETCCRCRRIICLCRRIDINSIIVTDMMLRNWQGRHDGAGHVVEAHILGAAHPTSVTVGPVGLSWGGCFDRDSHEGWGNVSWIGSTDMHGISCTGITIQCIEINILDRFFFCNKWKGSLGFISLSKRRWRSGTWISDL